MKFPWFRRVRPGPARRPQKIYGYPWSHRSPLILPVLLGKFILIGVVFYLFGKGVTPGSLVRALVPALVALALIVLALRELFVHFRRFPDFFYFDDDALVAGMANGKEARVPAGELVAIRRHPWRVQWFRPRSAYLELVTGGGVRFVLAPLLEGMDEFLGRLRQLNPECRWEVDQQ